MKKAVLQIVISMLFCVAVNAQWMQLPQDTDLQNCSVYFLNRDTGFVVGDRGFTNTNIQRTTDGGISWTQILVMNGLMPMVVCFGDDTTGYCGGQDGFVLKTIDGGMSWAYVNGLPFIGDDFGAMYFMNKDTGFISDFSGRIFRTADGSQSWTVVSSIQNSFENFFPGTGKFQFVNDSVGFLANGNYGIVMKTIDAGNSWSSIDLPSSNTWALSIYMFNKDSGMVTAENGKIWHTVNGGLNWNLTTIAGGYDLQDVIFITDSVGYIVGGENSNYIYHSPPYPAVGGLIYVTYDAGSTWHLDISLCCDWLTSVCKAGNNTVYAAGWNSWLFKLDSADVNTGEQEIVASERMEIYPNPVSDLLHISSPVSDFHVEISDVTGRTILLEENKNEINLSGFYDGMYFLKLYSKDSSYSEKIVVSH
jgi:photosystem II stability/assembly factor-like uncharacterized protein